MPIRVDQEAAFQRTGWLTSAGILILGVVGFVTSSLRAALDWRQLPGYLVGVFILVLVALGLEALARDDARRRFSPLEAEVPPAHLDALLPRLQRYLRLLWLVRLEDARGWKSIYDAEWAPAPRILPLELAKDGDRLVLRGSKVHVEAALKWLRRRGRSA